MESWLQCTVTPGQFRGEAGVEGRQFDGSVFSLFAPDQAVDSEGNPPARGDSRAGWVRVDVISRQNDLVLVRLPRPTFQDGPFITVRPEQLQTRPQGQGA
jgi:hypothetical protein